ncbi:hypothetical protein C1Y40_02325 [Mycobacterium talmoniae]|uniref:Uncharacterized protein n=1 Tax=Mycobacterium talmoniae TaxID=1858794 RepID=A0A2S8BLD9_9MYCO|nr:hypothetical protein C1Y40_02325 [Mycobacterium talmoniae]
MAANAAFEGANTTYGPFSITGTMLALGLTPPAISELNVEMSGMLASAVPTGWLLRSFQFGTADLKASQPGPCGSGICATGVGSGSADALMASGSDAATAATAAAPNALLARVFNVGSFVRLNRMLRAAITPRQRHTAPPTRLSGC